ncbi:hypothetical protein BH10ACI3_BH10ACI3_00050 [soil metagenome]
MQDLVIVESKKGKVRIAVLAAAGLSVLFCWFAVRWQLGDMLASLTGPNDPNAVDIAAMSNGLAPSDPVAKWLKAAVGSDAGEQPQTVIGYYEDVVRSAPFDYLWRIEIGRAYEQEGMTDQAEDQLKKAVELAPNYSFPHWHLGNFYLRQKRNDEAIAELKKAAENNQSYRDQVFSLVWDIFDRDPAVVESMAGTRTEAKARLAYFFAARGQAVDSLRNWNQLTDDQKAANPDTAKAIAHGLFLQHSYPQSLEFARQLGIDADAKPETITNGSFEKGLGDDKDSRFGWVLVRNDPKFEVAAESKVKHEGERSLKITFRTFVKPALTNLFQTVVVEPNKRYRLTFWVRTENLKSAGGPLVEIINANDDKLIGRSQTLPTGSNEWQQMFVDFTSPENCNGITIRTARAYCGEECPITGVFWYDDFAIERQ